MMYFDAITEAMTTLAKQKNALFVGQAVSFPGQAAFKTFDGVPMEKRLEMPVVEDFQMGFCTGLALAGYLPICFYPRADFLIIAANQIVNHLDKLPLMGAKPKVIIRTAIGRKEPLDPGPQHVGDYGRALSAMLRTVSVEEPKTPEDVIETYAKALAADHSTIIIEEMALY